VQWAKTFEHGLQTEAQDATEELPSPVWYGGPEQAKPKAFGLLNQDTTHYADS